MPYDAIRFHTILFPYHTILFRGEAVRISYQTIPYRHGATPPVPRLRACAHAAARRQPAIGSFNRSRRSPRSLRALQTSAGLCARSVPRVQCGNTAMLAHAAVDSRQNCLQSLCRSPYCRRGVRTARVLACCCEHLICAEGAARRCLLYCTVLHYTKCSSSMQPSVPRGEEMRLHTTVCVVQCSAVQYSIV